MLNVNQAHKHLAALDGGDDAARRQALSTLKSVDPHDWRAAPQPLVQSVIEALHQQLVNGPRPPVVHKDIAAILGNLGVLSKSAIPNLIQLLKSDIPDCVRESAAGALGRLGAAAKNAVDPLIELCQAPSNLAGHAVRALSEIGCSDQRVRATLVTLWNHPLQSQNGQMQLARAFCKLGLDAGGLVDFLTSHLLSSQDEALRKSAAEGLALCNKNKTEVVPALMVSMLHDKNEDVRGVAKAALDQLQLPLVNAIHICAKQLKESVHAEAALRYAGAPAVPALVEALKSPDTGVRLKATRILATFGEQAVDAVPALTSALRDRNADIRLAAAKSVWNITKKADDVVPVLVQLLDDKQTDAAADDEARRMYLQTVIEALWRIGPPASAAARALVSKSKDKNRLVSQSAREALKKIQPSALK